MTAHTRSAPRVPDERARVPQALALATRAARIAHTVPVSDDVERDRDFIRRRVVMLVVFCIPAFLVPAEDARTGFAWGLGLFCAGCAFVGGSVTLRVVTNVWPFARWVWTDK